MQRRVLFGGTIGSLLAVVVGKKSASARTMYCGKFLYYCPGKQNVVCGSGNHASCFRHRLRKGEAKRI